MRVIRVQSDFLSKDTGMFSWENTLFLIKHDGFGVLVCHLGHVSQNILFCDDAKKSPGKKQNIEIGGQ